MGTTKRTGSKSKNNSADSSERVGKGSEADRREAGRQALGKKGRGLFEKT